MADEPALPVLSSVLVEVALVLPVVAPLADIALVFASRMLFSNCAVKLPPDPETDIDKADPRGPLCTWENRTQSLNVR